MTDRMIQGRGTGHCLDCLSCIQDMVLLAVHYETCSSVFGFDPSGAFLLFITMQNQDLG